MPWTAEQHAIANQRLATFVTDYNTASGAWEQAVQGGTGGQGEAATQEVLRRWRQFSHELENAADMATSGSDGVMTVLHGIVESLEEEKAVLKGLRSEAGTRSDQADSLNPKVRPSPYVNILGLQRTFRDSTRVGILIASIVFGVLALAVLGYLVYRIVFAAQGAFNPSGPNLMGGGGR
jgi:hypothetical protein